ncbi:MAG: nucleotide disphospho-sugar-binding domain-containing protein [Ilumatobacteraceae bacterium]
MTLLVISPAYVSHYGPLSVVGAAVKQAGQRVVVATGSMLRERVEADGFEWRPLALGASSNAGIVSESPAISRFLDATRAGAVATIRRQALDREHDLLWKPEQVASDIADLVDRLQPDEVLVDHVSFGSTLGMYATGRSFVTLVPGHPSQLPVGDERYGVPSAWPESLRPDRADLDELDALADRVGRTFTRRWNEALDAVAPDRPPVADAFRVHGRRVLFNSRAELHAEARSRLLPADSLFVGPLVRDEALPERYATWAVRTPNRPQAYVALGTFLSHRNDVLVRIAEALRRHDVRAAIALGSTPPTALGDVPGDWLIAPHLPQVALLGHADIAIHHGGNNSVQEALSAGARQVTLPFSTDQFANAADLERNGVAVVADPNRASITTIADAVESAMARPAAPRTTTINPDRLVDAVVETTEPSLPVA